MGLVFRQISSCAIGNILDFYDFIIYGIFATVIAKTFFSNLPPAQALLHTFLVLTMGYFTRPIGGILFGYLGDRFNSRAALCLAMVIMAISTAAIGFLPSYARIGVLAPALLVIFRLLQGLAVSGESANAMVFLYEQAPCRWLALTTIMALSVAYVVTPHYWRLSFIVSLFLGLIGLYLRLSINGNKKWPSEKFSVLSIKQSGMTIVLAIGVLVYPAVYTAFTTIFLVPFLVTQHLFAFQQALEVNVVVMLTMFIALMLGAFIADMLKQYRYMMVVGFVICIVTTLPLFFLLLKGHGYTWLALIVFTALGGFAMGPEVVVLVELFAPQFRCRGVGLRHGSAFSCITGLCPSLFRLLLLHFSIFAIAYIMMAAALLSVIALTVKLPPVHEVSIPDAIHFAN